MPAISRVERSQFEIDFVALKRELLPWMRQFHEYDLYSKGDAPPDVAALKPYYQELIAEFFPPQINW